MRRHDDTGIGQALEAAVGSPIVAASPVSGGDIGDSRRVDLADGRSLFVKDYGAASPGLAVAEAHGLTWLAEAGTSLTIPDPVAVADTWLALPFVESSPPAPDFDERLGRGLAALHRTREATPGLDRDNWIGRLPQRNDAPGPEPVDSWARFYEERRLVPLRGRAREAGLLTPDAERGLDRVLDRLAELVGPREPLSRLHGDLWSGNVLAGASGEPVLIDPAVYAGHREVDLAMMQLFGGFSARVFDAYDEAHPLAEGWRRRVPLYQLYPILVHVCLFGASYVGRLMDALGGLESVGPGA